MNGATAVFPGRVDRVLGCYCVDRLCHWRQEISDTLSSVLSFGFGFRLFRWVSFVDLFTIVLMIRIICGLCSFSYSHVALSLRRFRGHVAGRVARRACPDRASKLSPRLHLPLSLFPSTLPSPPLFLLPDHTAPQPPPHSPQDQSTPLHTAAWNCQEAACRMIIAAGAKVDAKDEVSCD